MSENEVTEKAVCVVTVTYSNRVQYLEQVIARVLSFENVKTVVVVDNDSSEETKWYLRSLEPDPRVQCVQLDRNNGSAEGFYWGIRLAEETDCTYVWLLDDDNLPGKEALDALLCSPSRHEKHASLSLRDDRREYVEFAAGAKRHLCFGRSSSFLGFSILDIPRKLGLHRESRIACTDPENLIVPYAPYGGFFFERLMIQQVHLPERRFGLYGDDHEYTYRFTTCGIPIVLRPSSRLTDLEKSWHLARKRTLLAVAYVITEHGVDKRKRMYFAVRNRIYFESRHLYGISIGYLLNALFYFGIVGASSVISGIALMSFAPILGFRTFVLAIFDGLMGNLENCE